MTYRANINSELKASKRRRKKVSNWKWELNVFFPPLLQQKSDIVVDYKSSLKQHALSTCRLHNVNAFLSWLGGKKREEKNNERGKKRGNLNESHVKSTTKYNHEELEILDLHDCEARAMIARKKEKWRWNLFYHVQLFVSYILLLSRGQTILIFNNIPRKKCICLSFSIPLSLTHCVPTSCS